jgi:DNA-binding MarR family transcriptional regulator
LNKKKKLTFFFLRDKPSMVLLQLLKENTKRYASVIAKEVDCTYSHTVRILQEFNKRGLVTFDRKGRQKLIDLTKKGREIAENMKKLVNSLD